MRVPILYTFRDTESGHIIIKWGENPEVSVSDITSLCMSVIGSFLTIVPEDKKKDCQDSILKSLVIAKDHYDDYKVPLTKDGKVIVNQP